jgi:hypothetical protein
VPVPVPPTPLAINEPAKSAASAPSISAIAPVPQAVPVPTAPVSGPQPDSSFEHASLSGSSTAWTIPMVSTEGAIVIALTLLVLLISIGLYRMPGVRP